MTSPSPAPLAPSRIGYRAVALVSGLAFAGSLAVHALAVSERAEQPVGADQSSAPTGEGSSAGASEGVPELFTPDEAKLTASDRATGDSFGFSVALSGERALVGAFKDDDLGVDSGSAYVFERQSDGMWAEVARLTASDGAAGDSLGVSVALSGERALVGAHQGDGLPADTGSAYVFERQSDGTWVEVDELTASDGEADDRFGVSVALSGERAVVGASQGDGVRQESGLVYVLERQADGTWAEVGKIMALDGAGFDYFGGSVALSGDRVVVGAHGDDAARGSAYLFERQADGTWVEATKLTAADGMRYDEFGVSVALSGELAVVGAFHDDDIGEDSGSAYVYSLQRCELDLALEPSKLRAGELLRVMISLHHRRALTVTVPLLLWIEDADGRVVAQESSPPVSFEPGDHRQVRMSVTVPPGTRLGPYRVVVGVRRMQQGIAWGSREFEIVE